MNEAQETYVKAAAHTIEMHAEAIRLRMQAMQRDSLADMPTKLVQLRLQDVTHYCRAMQQVLNETLPHLTADTTLNTEEEE